MTDLDAPRSTRAQTARGEASDLGRLARGGVANLVGAASAAGLSLAFVVALTHVASREDLGVFMAATSVFLVLATTGKLGANTGTVYFVARLRTLGSHDRLREFLDAALRPVVILSLCLSVATAVAAPVLSSLFLDDAADGVATLRVLAIFIPLAALSDVCLAATRGFGIVRALVLVEKIGRPLGQLLLLGLAVLIGWKSSVALAWVWAFPYLPAAVAALVWMTAALRRAERSPVTGETRPDAEPIGKTRTAAGEFWRFTAPQGIASVVQVVLQRLDIILLAMLRGPVEAAVYGAVTRVLVVGQLGGQALLATAQPAVSALMAHNDRRELSRVYQASTGWLVIATWPFYLLLAVYHQKVPNVFGAGYSSGAPVVLILCLTMLVATGVGMVDVLLSMSGRTRWVLGNSLTALAVNVVLNLTLIPRWGVVGAAVAWAAAIGVNNLVPLMQIGITLRVHPFGRGFRAAAVLAGCCFGALPLASRAALGDDLTVILGSVALASALYATGLWALRRPLALSELKSASRRGRREAQASAGSADRTLPDSHSPRR